MFRWYQDAEACYAFLSDVCVVPDTSMPDILIMDNSTTDGSVTHSSDPAWIGDFYTSKWFTRGWTLQELLAPDNVIFFDKKWTALGTKDSLEFHISAITGIKDIFNFDKASIAQRFSWASRRQTTRVEDAAYCLMGLFRVNMALLYVSIISRLSRFLFFNFRTPSCLSCIVRFYFQSHNRFVVYFPSHA